MTDIRWIQLICYILLIVLGLFSINLHGQVFRFRFSAWIALAAIIIIAVALGFLGFWLEGPTS